MVAKTSDPRCCMTLAMHTCNRQVDLMEESEEDEAERPLTRTYAAIPNAVTYCRNST